MSFFFLHKHPLAVRLCNQQPTLRKEETMPFNTKERNKQRASEIKKYTQEELLEHNAGAIEVFKKWEASKAAAEKAAAKAEKTKDPADEAKARSLKAKAKEAQDAYVIFMWEELQDLVYKRIHENLFLRGSDLEDLVSEAKTGLIGNILEYNPTWCMPSSYFMIRIDQYLKQAAHQGSNLSSHYIQKLLKLDKVARKAGYEGAFDPDLSHPELAQLANESIQTVVNTLEQANYKNTSLLEAKDTETGRGDFMNPADKVLLDEMRIFVAKAFHSLSLYEQFLLKMRYTHINEDGSVGVSGRKILEELNDPEKREELGIGETEVFDNNRIQADEQRAISKLRHVPGMQERFGYMRHSKAPVGMKTYRQAPDETIMSQITNL